MGHVANVVAGIPPGLVPAWRSAWGSCSDVAAAAVALALPSMPPLGSQLSVAPGQGGEAHEGPCRHPDPVSAAGCTCGPQLSLTLDIWVVRAVAISAAPQAEGPAEDGSGVGEPEGAEGCSCLPGPCRSLAPLGDRSLPPDPDAPLQSPAELSCASDAESEDCCMAESGRARRAGCPIGDPEPGRGEGAGLPVALEVGCAACAASRVLLVDLGSRMTALRCLNCCR